ncbi:MAG TPA: hypothetical protein VND44_10515 [Acidimicrobiales bacterium]|nr:hypothetical protein [Acidimicrobiales bacterium]
MTPPTPTERCGWCHRPLPPRPGAGRPRRFCSPSHRQRAYEARRRADELRVPPDQCIVSVADLGRLHDRLYRLEAAVEDVAADLAASRGAAAYRHAYEHLLDAAADLVGTVVEPVVR